MRKKYKGEFYTLAYKYIYYVKEDEITEGAYILRNVVRKQRDKILCYPSHTLP